MLKKIEKQGALTHEKAKEIIKAEQIEQQIKKAQVEANYYNKLLEDEKKMLNEQKKVSEQMKEDARANDFSKRKNINQPNAKFPKIIKEESDEEILNNVRRIELENKKRIEKEEEEKKNQIQKYKEDLRKQIEEKTNSVNNSKKEEKLNNK